VGIPGSLLFLAEKLPDKKLKDILPDYSQKRRFGGVEI
jgi:hypothetical protein